MRARLFIILLLLLQGACSISGGQTHISEPSDHFDGKRFYNREGDSKTLGDLLWFSLQLPFGKQPWPKWIDEPAGHIANQRVFGSAISVTFINHASFLIQVDGVNILTDPIFSQRASPLSWLGPKRVRDSGISLDQLPEIDVILISHDHYDHLDLPSLRKIKDRAIQTREPLILSGLGTQAVLAKAALRHVHTLDWGESFTHSGLEFVFSESKHQSGRGILDQRATLWGSFVIKTRQGNIYFAGDTGYGAHFKAAAKRFGSFRLSLLPIGAYQPRSFLQAVHLNPQEAVQAHRDLNAQHSIGMHYGTFQLTFETIDQPVRDLQQALKAMQVPTSAFSVLGFGKTRIFAQIQP